MSIAVEETGHVILLTGRACESDLQPAIKKRIGIVIGFARRRAPKVYHKRALSAAITFDDGIENRPADSLEELAVGFVGDWKAPAAFSFVQP